MQPHIETEHTRANREVTAEALRNIEARLARLDQSTPEGARLARVARGQMKILPAFLEWLASDREMGASDRDCYIAGANCLSNVFSSLLGSTIQPAGHLAAIGNTLIALREHMILQLLQEHGDAVVIRRDYQPNEGRA